MILICGASGLVGKEMCSLLDTKKMKIIKSITYSHPVYSEQAFQNQSRHSEISGMNNIHFCGAYWGYGFHEDGVKSALKVCQRWGVTL